MDDLTFASAHELASGIRQGRVSALEVLEEHLAHIARHNPALNAIVTLDEEGARRRAEEADAALARGEVWGPLHGVPVTFKDCFETAGLRTTSSYPPLADHVPRRDATVVARLRGAGAVLLGKTNLPPLASDWQTRSPIFGRTRNPWDAGRTAGGSSGGSAAAVAAGLSPLDVGSDLAGSIRVPSHFCGVYGLKPTEHRVSSAGHIPDWRLPGTPGAGGNLRHLGTYGPIARCVEDLRLSLALLAGPDGRQVEVPPVPLRTPPRRPLEDCRFAWTADCGGVPVTAETRRALADLADTLSRLGCRVEERSLPDFDFDAAWRCWGEITGAEIGAALPARTRLRMATRLLSMSARSPMDRGLARGATLGRRRYLQALGRRAVLVRALESFLADWDAWLCPVTTGPAFTHRKTGRPIEVDGHEIPYAMGVGAHASLFNLGGQPVVALPVARSAEGLPIGVQVVGRRWEDEELLSIAESLAEVAGGFRRPPGF